MSEISDKVSGIEKFYKEAFCAKQAKFVNVDQYENFSIGGVIEIDSGDDRGVFYVASVIKNDK